jgi:hypothetical protein
VPALWLTPALHASARLPACLFHVRLQGWKNAAEMGLDDLDMASA